MSFDEVSYNFGGSSWALKDCPKKLMSMPTFMRNLLSAPSFKEMLRNTAVSTCEPIYDKKGIISQGCTTTGDLILRIGYADNKILQYTDR